MSPYPSVANLGRNILIVVDNLPGFSNALRAALADLPNTAHRSFTLLCCCPPNYWEHGGAGNPQVQAQIRSMTERESSDFDCAERCLAQAASVLSELGIAEHNIHTRIATDDRRITSIMQAVKRHHYTGVIISSYHVDVIARLRRSGFTDMFRRIPHVEVCALDVSAEAVAQA